MPNSVGGIVYSDDMKTVVGVESAVAVDAAVVAEGVEEIGKFAFQNSLYRRIVIPEGVKRIGEGAFFMCERLKCLELPTGLLKIGKAAFSRCASLVELEIPQTVSEIGEKAFDGCVRLERVTLPDSLEKIDYAWFDSLPKSYELFCAEGSAAFSSVRRSRKVSAHVRALAREIAKSEKVKEIQRAGAEAVVRTIAGRHGDAGEIELEILNQTKSAVLLLVRAGNSTALLRLNPDAAKWAESLGEFVSILADGTKGGEDVMREMGRLRLRLAKVPVSKSIEWKADGNGRARFFCAGKFHGRVPKNLREVELFGVEGFGCAAFSGCSIENLSHPALTIRGGIAIEDGKVLYCANHTARRITIPDGITEISWSAFGGCSVETIDVPASVRSIRTSAFGNCFSLREINFGGTRKQWQDALRAHAIMPKNARVRCSDGVCDSVF